MTKRSSAPRKPAAAKAKPDTTAQAISTHERVEVVPTAAAAPEIPAASGADVKPEDAAATAGGTDAKAPETQTSSDAVDPAGTGSAPAAQPEESREQAGAPSPDRKGGAEEGKQPEETALPPVAGAVLIVTGPKKGFRRGGLSFDAEPTVLTEAEFGEQFELKQLERLLAILTEPALKCAFRLEDGSEEPVTPERIEAIRAAIADRSADA